MCRSTTENGDFHCARERQRLKIRSFHLRLSLDVAVAGCGGCRPRLPDALTLVYLPRISGNVLEVNNAKVPPDSEAIVALHRVVAGVGEAEAVFASTDRVRASDGVRFEAYVGARKTVRGIFRRVSGQAWALECQSAAEGETGVVAAELEVAAEGGVVMRERVEMERRRQRRKRNGFCSRLEEIPEESDGCDCCCCGDDDEEEVAWEMVGSDGGDWDGEETMDGQDDWLEKERVMWAVDVGIWVVCLGVGVLFSKAGSRRKSFF